MPTGYTAELCDKDVPFEKFVMACARGMGACITMRDDPPDMEIPDEFKPSEYYEKAISNARAEIKRLGSLSKEDIATEAKKEYELELESFGNCAHKAAATKGRLEAMLCRVRNWKPPTDEHNDFRDFMAEQLETTLKHDGKVYLDYPTAKDPSAWHFEKMRQATRNIEYYTEQHKEEVERCRSHSKWVRDLRLSLK